MRCPRVRQNGGKDFESRGHERPDAGHDLPPSSDLNGAIAEHPEINWNEYASQSMWEYVHTLEITVQVTPRSELSEADAKERES